MPNIFSSKKEKEQPAFDAITAVKTFIDLHKTNPSDNLNVIPLLRCPKYGGKLELNGDRTRAVSKEAGIYYPVEDNTPIMISSEANRL